MLFSGRGSVNTVSNGSLITKGLPLVQYKTARTPLVCSLFHYWVMTSAFQNMLII